MFFVCVTKYMARVFRYISVCFCGVLSMDRRAFKYISGKWVKMPPPDSLRKGKKIHVLLAAKTKVYYSRQDTKKGGNATAPP